MFFHWRSLDCYVSDILKQVAILDNSRPEILTVFLSVLINLFSFTQIFLYECECEVNFLCVRIGTAYGHILQ